MAPAPLSALRLFAYAAGYRHRVKSLSLHAKQCVFPVQGARACGAGQPAVHGRTVWLLPKHATSFKTGPLIVFRK